MGSDDLEGGDSARADVDFFRGIDGTTTVGDEGGDERIEDVSEEGMSVRREEKGRVVWKGPEVLCRGRGP